MLIDDEGRNYTAAEYGQWLTEPASASHAASPATSPAPTASSPAAYRFEVRHLEPEPEPDIRRVVHGASNAIAMRA
jgi:hypothetical protein